MTHVQILKQKIMLSEAHYKIIQPLVLTSKIFAVCPLSFKKIGNNYQIKYSPFLVLYSYIFVIAFGIGTVLGVQTDIGQGKNAIRMTNTKTRYISFCDMFIVFMIALFGIVCIPCKMRKFVKLLDIWSQVDSIIPITNYKKYRKNSIIFLSTTVSAAILLFIFDIFIYCLQWKVSSDPTFYIQLYISYYMFYLILVFQEIFFWHLVYFVHIRLASLNENLIREKRNLKKSLKIFFVIPHFINNLSKTTDVATDRRTNVSGRNSLDDKTTKLGKNAANRIQELFQMYQKIKESVEILNGSSSYGIVLIMLSCLLHLVVTPYFLLVEIIKQNASMLFILLQSVWLIAHIGRLLIMVEPCQRCINEYKMTCDLVTEMTQLDFDDETKKSLKDFVSIFSYADIKFHACGFFDINRNLLTSVAGAVTTYLVILFQFGGADGT